MEQFMMDKYSDMDVLQRFNLELSSLNEARLPISKNRITEITNSALEGVKMYKHIVQSVERFIFKCKPEYKLCGLYVIDSIVRQSKHHEAVRDVYPKRFTQNLLKTVQNLFLTCLPDHKWKITRVLNLWQKNHVFPSHIIQLCLDLAHNPKAPIDTQAFAEKTDKKHPSTVLNQFDLTAPIQSADEASRIVSKLAQNLTVANNGAKDTLVSQLELLGHALEKLKNEEAVTKDKATSSSNISDIIDDDEGSYTPTEAEPIYIKPGAKTNKQTTFANLVHNLLNDTNLLSKIGNEQLNATLNQVGDPFLQANAAAFKQIVNNSQLPSFEQNNGKTEGGGQSFPTFLPQQIPQQPQFDFEANLISNDAYYGSNSKGTNSRSNSEFQHSFSSSERLPNLDDGYNRDRNRDTDYRDNRGKDRDRSYRDRERDRDRDQDYRRSYSERSRPRSRSRSPARPRKPSPPVRPRREENVFPPKREHYATIGSITLWLGHLSKQIGESELRHFFKKTADIKQIDLYPSRGCAYVCFNNRHDAQKGYDELKLRREINGEKVKYDWAPGKGVKGEEFKQYWERENGCSFIPHSVLSNIETIEEGGQIDKASLPEHLKAMYEELQRRRAEGPTEVNDVSSNAEPPLTTAPWNDTNANTVQPSMFTEPKQQQQQDMSFAFDHIPPPPPTVHLPPIGTWNPSGELFKSIDTVVPNQQSDFASNGTIPLLPLPPQLSEAQYYLNNHTNNNHSSVISPPNVSKADTQKLYETKASKFALSVPLNHNHIDADMRNDSQDSSENLSFDNQDNHDYKPPLGFNMHPMPFYPPQMMPVGPMAPPGPLMPPDNFQSNPFAPSAYEQAFMDRNPQLMDLNQPHQMPFDMPPMGHPHFEHRPMHPPFDMPRFNRPPMHFDQFMRPPPPHFRHPPPRHQRFPGGPGSQPPPRLWLPQSGGGGPPRSNFRGNNFRGRNGGGSRWNNERGKFKLDNRNNNRNGQSETNHQGGAEEQTAEEDQIQAESLDSAENSQNEIIETS